MPQHPPVLIRSFLLLLTLVSLLAACAPLQPPTPSATPDPWAIPPELDGTRWLLVELNGRPPITGSNISLEFKDGRVGGYAGCNWYGGPYAPPGETSTPQVTFTITARACAEPTGVQEQESAFVQALQAAATREAAEGRLSFRDADGNVTLVFEQDVLAVNDPAALVGTAWQLQSVDGQPFLPETPPTLRFDGATELSGFAGCREFRGTYAATATDINVSYLEMTTTECADAARLEPEGTYTTYLGEIASYRLEGSRLTLNTDGGAVLVFISR